MQKTSEDMLYENASTKCNFVRMELDKLSTMKTLPLAFVSEFKKMSAFILLGTASPFGPPQPDQIPKVLSHISQQLSFILESDSQNVAAATEQIETIITVCNSLRSVSDQCKLFNCPECASEHDLSGYDLSFCRPDAFLTILASQHANCIDMDDICVIDGEHCFVRGLLSFPLSEQNSAFTIGIWVQTERDWFRTYADYYFLKLTGQKDCGKVFNTTAVIANDFPILLSVLGETVDVSLDESAPLPRFTLQNKDENNELARYQQTGFSNVDFGRYFAKYFHAGLS